MTERAPAAPFYEVVTRALKEQGKSLVWLHKQTGVARDTIYAWKKQPRPPLARTVTAVAEALGINRAEALRLAGVLDDVTVETDTGPVSLAEVDTDVLLAEVRRRIPD